jgi:hypothetical protein
MWNGTREIARLLQSVFAAELLAPSRRIFLISPWITDIPVLDNTAGQFSSLVPDWDRVPIRLSRALIRLAETGSEVLVLARKDYRNQAFLDRMTDAQDRLPAQIHIKCTPSLHEKGLLGDRYYLFGSFNFTHNGIAVLKERATFITESGRIAEHRLSLEQHWEELDP